MKHIIIFSLLIACSAQQLHGSQTSHVKPCSKKALFAVFPKSAKTTLHKSVFLQNMIQEEIESQRIYHLMNEANVRYNQTSPVSGTGNYLKGRKEDAVS